MYRLLVSDIDATLINKDFEVPEYNRTMIKRVLDEGIDFMLCTGRIFGSARPYARGLKLSAPIITSNGAITMDWKTKETIFENHIPSDVCEEIFDALDELGFYYHFYTREAFYTRKFLFGGEYISKMNQGLPEEERFPTLEIDDPHGIARIDPVYKISVRCEDEEKSEAFMKVFSGRSDIEITSSMADNYEISTIGVNKGNALKLYAEMNGIKPEEIMAFGDNLNDVGMIKYAGTGVAVGNAVEQLKAAADYITDTNENSGVGKAIAHLVFGE